MIGIFLIFILGIGIVLYTPKEEDTKIPSVLSNQLDKLWKIAQDAIKDQKVLRAEKALLTILRFDEKNAAAYNRLGILYAKQKQFKEAIECFEIAQSLDGNASSLHNVGLIYLETGNYEKAALAFEQALELENDLPTRYIAYAKSQESLGNRRKALEALEAAYSLEKSPQILRQMAGIYAAAGEEEKVEEIRRKLEKLVAQKISAAPQIQKRPRKLVM